MGNCPACFSSTSVHDAGEEDSVKVVRVTDGELFEYPGPVYAKDLMHGFQGFAVFHYSSVKQPLPPETELKFSEVYYLRPWVSQEKSEKTSDSGKPGTTSEQKHVRSEAEKKVKRVRFKLNEEPQKAQDAVSRSQLEDRIPQIEVLPDEDQKRVVRLKFRISKKQLSELMSTTETTDALVERIIAPLLCPARSVAPAQNMGSLSPPTSWKPCLKKIPEGREFARSM